VGIGEGEGYAWRSIVGSIDAMAVTEDIGIALQLRSEIAIGYLKYYKVWKVLLT